MTAYNIVRFRTKPGKDKAFIDAHEKATPEVAGFQGAALVRTGENTFCFVGKWESMERLAAARQPMIAILDTFRDLLEDLGGGLGLTDPASGTVVVKIRS